MWTAVCLVHRIQRVVQALHAVFVVMASLEQWMKPQMCPAQVCMVSVYIITYNMHAQHDWMDLTGVHEMHEQVDPI